MTSRHPRTSVDQSAKLSFPSWFEYADMPVLDPEEAVMSRESSHDATAWWANIEAWPQRVQNMPEPPGGATAEAFEELRVAWEELRASQEEVSEQQEALAASRQTLEVERQRYRELFDLAPEAYLVTDLYGAIQEANGLAGTLLHLAPPRLIGKPLAVFIAEKDRPAFRTLLAQLKDEQSARDWEVRVKPFRSPTFPGALSTTLARTLQGELVGLRWLLRDITRRKQAEEALQQVNATLEERVRERTAEVSLLLRESHHRMKNNFQLIASLLDLQADASVDPQVHAVLEKCQHRLQTMALIHERVHQSEDPDRIDVTRYLNTLATQLFEAYSAEGQPVTLSLHLEEVWMPFKTAIPCGLIVNELLSNALKHAFPPGTSGEVAVALRTEADGRLSLAVRDTGVGVPAGLDVRQANSLGLQLVSLLTEQLGGTLELDRRQGTTVALTFPLP
jgi:two-component system, sensor histidine kinase PdtaS